MTSIILQQLKKIEPDSNFSQTSNGYQGTARYFTKLGSPTEKDQYVGEAESLQAINTAAPGLAPKLLAFGTDEASSKPYFISEYKDLAPLTESAARILGERMAKELHMYKSTQGFGFAVPTYCGVTRLENGWHESWQDCFSSLIGGLLAKLTRQEYKELVKKGETVRQRYIIHV